MMKEGVRWRQWSVLVGLTLVSGLGLAQFVAPSKDARVAAAGSLKGLEPGLRRAFSNHGEFEPKRKPGPGDWLAQHREPGQSFEQYRDSRANMPGGGRSTLYLLPIGVFEKGRGPGLESLREYAERYFVPLKVELLPAVAESKMRIASRINRSSKERQINSVQVLNWMTPRVPKDAYAVIAVTMTDLYPEESWNFVFGQASLRDRVGVFSFARYHPSFYGRKSGKETEQAVLLRALKVLVHETGHMFGIAHCIHYQCLMNGSNHLQEADESPLHLCPVCLRKLHHALKFDPPTRYRGMREFYQVNGLRDQERWVERRLAEIGRDP